MFQQTQFLDIVFLVVVALFLFARLRSVLGTRPDKSDTRDSHAADMNIVDISDYRTVHTAENADNRQNDEEDDEHIAEQAEEKDILPEYMGNADAGTAETFEKIKKIVPSFSLKSFLNKASKAFEYIAVAFAAGDKESLKPLVTPDLYEKFVTVIDDRKSRNEKVEFALIGFESVTVVKAELFGSIAELTVEFITDQTNIVKDADGKIIEGDPTYIESVLDVWTLRKDLKNQTPVWVLVETKQKAA